MNICKCLAGWQQQLGSGLIASAVFHITMNIEYIKCQNYSYIRKIYITCQSLYHIQIKAKDHPNSQFCVSSLNPSQKEKQRKSAPLEAFFCQNFSQTSRRPKTEKPSLKLSTLQILPADCLKVDEVELETFVFSVYFLVCLFSLSK